MPLTYKVALVRRALAAGEEMTTFGAVKSGTANGSEKSGMPLVFASGLTSTEAAERTDQILDIMHLSIWEQSRPASLPLEVRQTAALARALSSRPPLVLLENPLSSVDTRETRRLLSLCRAQCESLLIATHRKDGILHEFADAVWEWDDDGFRVAA